MSSRGTRASAATLAAACLLLPGIATSQSTSGVITAVSANSSLIRPDLSLAGRVFVDGPTGNVAIGDISSYNTTVAPVAKLEVDGDALVRGHLTFDDSNGDSSLVVVPSNPAALTLKDAASTPVVYAVVNSNTGRLETHAPLHVLDTRVEAKDDHPTGLQITAEAGNPMLTFDTTDGAENVVASYRITVEDASDSCGTSTDATCALNASVVAAGGLTVTKKSFLTGTVRVADTTDASSDSNDDVDGSVRLAGGLAVEKSAFVKAKVKILSDEDGDASGAGALYVKGGAAIFGHAHVGKDTSHAVTLDDHLVAYADTVNITAAAANATGVTLSAPGDGGVVSAVAKQSVVVAAHSSLGTGGVTIVSGRSSAGHVTIQQDASGDGSAPSDRLVVDADGGVTVTTNAGESLTFASEGAVPSVISLNARSAAVSKTVTITNAAGTTGTAATLRLENGKSARLFVSVATTWGDGKPATLAAEFLVAHHGGNAPEPSASATPPRTGLRRATAEVGGGTDGALEVTVTPDDSGGAAATKDFVVRVYAADGGSGDAPASATAVVVARAEGTFVSLG